MSGQPRWVQYLVLPPEITAVERTYLARINRVALFYFLAHLPVMVGVALLCHTDAKLAALLSAMVLVGPVLAYKTLSNPRRVSMVFGLASMFMGGLLVHFGQGSMQIEMHFYFFVSLALLVVFANPLVVVAAAVTVAAHHALLYFLLPHSVFNYDASLWTVAVHALFVVLESVAACFIARSFFDNVVGLEKIINRRTQELDNRNRDLRFVMDNVGQGFLSVDGQGRMAVEHSRIVDDWFGPMGPEATAWEYFGKGNEEFGTWLKLGWESLHEGVFPLEVALDQFPKRMKLRQKTFQLDFKPVTANDQLSKVLMIVSDITDHLEKERSEAGQRELLSLFQHIAGDRAGFVEFFTEAQQIMAQLVSQESKLSSIEVKRLLHTLKGNALTFGVSSISSICHQIETDLSENDSELVPRMKRELLSAWEECHSKITLFLGGNRPKTIEVEDGDYLDVVEAVRAGVSRAEITRMMREWRFELADVRLTRIAEQARGMADRLGKPGLKVTCISDGTRFQPESWAEFWPVFTHIVRNAVDHGIEDLNERTTLGKSPEGNLRLEVKSTPTEVSVSLSDDGRGLQWDAIRAVAQKANLPCETQADLIAALFHDGLTTKDSVTEYSGRGIGMGAVRAACTRMGGSLDVSSEPGRGTRFQFRFPLGDLASTPHPGARITGPSSDRQAVLAQ